MENFFLFCGDFMSNANNFSSHPLYLLRTSHPSTLPSWNEKDVPHAEKTMKNHRFSPLFSIFGLRPKNGEKWRKSLLFRVFLGVWCAVFARVWQEGSVRGML